MLRQATGTAENSADVGAEGYRAFIDRRKRRAAATMEALSNPDIVACILRGNVGLSTFSAASEVSRAWFTACRSDATVLRAVALRQGGLTSPELTHLFAISRKESAALPCTKACARNGGVYYVHGEPAVDALLEGPDGLQAWRLRLRARAESPWSPLILWPPPKPSTRRARWQFEENQRVLAR